MTSTFSFFSRAVIINICTLPANTMNILHLLCSSNCGAAFCAMHKASICKSVTLGSWVPLPAKQYLRLVKLCERDHRLVLTLVRLAAPLEHAGVYVTAEYLVYKAI